MSDYKEQCWKRYMENKKYERYDKEDLIDEIIEMQGEIERLNNIINKLEKYIEKETRIYGLSMSIELGTHFDNILDILNQEIVITKHKEIIEEDKKIEKLTIGKDDVAWCEGNMKTDEEMVDIVLEIKDKINEIIDYIMEDK